MLVGCASTEKTGLSEYNCSGLTGWIKKAEASNAGAHKLTLAWAEPDRNGDEITIPLFAALTAPPEIIPIVEEYYHAIVQPTHYISLRAYTRRAASCFDSKISKTKTGLKFVAPVSQSTFVMEYVDMCTPNTEEDCEFIRLRYIP
ncbi:MAG: hypothetical protein ACWA5T_09640 [Parvularcula sp.]